MTESAPPAAEIARLRAKVSEQGALHGGFKSEVMALRPTVAALREENARLVRRCESLQQTEQEQRENKRRSKRRAEIAEGELLQARRRIADLEDRLGRVRAEVLLQTDDLQTEDARRQTDTSAESE
jgi:predicted RNase H-like nuclease (RuvC/YqgF family)